MITLRAVVELPTDPTRIWPARTPTGPWLTLHAGSPPEEIELFVSILAADLDVAPPGGRDEVVDALLREDLLLAAGGLRLDDPATGATVSPGCCAGLEDWREWTSALDGGTPWLGHDPGPEIEARGGLLRVWQHGGPDRRGPYVELTPAHLAELLASAQSDLRGFLARLDAWARDARLGVRGAALVTAVDRDFRITAPLELPGGGPEPPYLT
ncbi:hypothetical protein ACGFI9_00265 [Micromonospora sp. NPDC048930]|uniref:hypothetical protein n=1 Tax=Micromonospora sp. NPDC048930 TaxID=3364261 RepID=UPI00372430FA